ncbi:MAG: insulinase family protein [Nitrospirae bacterium]|nr:MAG: insulinase family protein [Nitrospirota bacterium]
MFIARLVFIGVCLFLFSDAQASQVKEFRLKNGLKVLIVEDHKAPLATFQIWYRVGSMDEPTGKTGISHLLEHMMFKGTPKYGSKVFSNIIQKNGGGDNAHTSKDYTMYFQTLSSDRLHLSIKLEADRMRNLLLDPKEVSSEKNVVMEERRMRYEDSPQNLLYEEVIAASMKTHSYRWPVIGWMSDIASIERKDLFEHYRRMYSPDNAFIVIAGDVDPEKIMSDIKKHFGRIKPSGLRKKTAKKNTVNAEPGQNGERRIYLKKEAELPYIVMAYHTPNFPDNDSYALDVMATVLSDGKSSRLYKSLVYEKKMALNSGADYNGFHRDPFIFTFAATAAPGKDIGEIEETIYDEIEKIKKEPPSDKEVRKAKNQIESSFVFAQDATYTKAYYAGMFEMLGDWRLMDRYLEGIRKVSPQDLQAVAGKYLNELNRTTGILVPQKKKGGPGEQQ